MGFNNRTPSPIDPAVDPLLPQADSSQAHDIPTGVSPTTAKLQDWIAWLSANSVLYTSPGVVANDIEIDGDLSVTGTLDVAEAVTLDSSLSVGTTISGASVAASGELAGSYVRTTGASPASNADPGANRLHGANMVKAWAAIRFDGGVVTVLDGYNISGVTVSIGTIAIVTLARAMANADYAVVHSVGGNGHQRKYATTQETGKTTTVFHFNVWDELAGTVVDLDDGGTDIVVSVCVMGRQ